MSSKSKKSQSQKKPKVQRKGKPKKKHPNGTYFVPLGSTVGGLLGAAMGGPPGAAAGAVIGGSLGGMAAQITGVGTYHVKRNSFLPGSSIPVVENRKRLNDGSTIYTKHEYLGDIITSSVARAFKLQSFSINPGQETTFPLLSQLAENFDEYEFEGLVFMFRSMSADALNNVDTSLGTVIMSTNYNAANPNFATKAEMEEYEYSTSARPSINQLHYVECDPNQNVFDSLFIRPLAPASGTDIRLYDLGVFQIATSGFQGTNVNIGELWVTYQVRLRKSKLWSALGNSNVVAHCNSLTGVANATPLGTGPFSQGNTGSGLFIKTGNTLTFPLSPVNQNYLVYTYWGGTNTVLNGPGLAFNSAMTPILGIVAGLVSGAQAPPNGGNSASFVQISTITVLANQLGVYTWGAAGTLPTALTDFEMLIVQLPTLLAP